MKTQVARWGNSLAVRIPRHIASAAKLKAGDAVVVESEGPGTVRLNKPEKKLSLKGLVDAIKPENIHAETDWTEARGNEVW